MPQPIDTAPRDGTPILTDCGVVRSRHPPFHINGYWYFCDSQGTVFTDGGWDYTARPSFWEPIPAWLNS